MTSATAINTAMQYLDNARNIILTECQKRKWDTRAEIEQLSQVLDKVDNARITAIKFMVSTFGFDYWKVIQSEVKDDLID